MGSESKYYGPATTGTAPGKDGASAGLGYTQTGPGSIAGAAAHAEAQTSDDLGKSSIQGNLLYARGKFQANGFKTKDGKSQLGGVNAEIKVSAVNVQASDETDLGAAFLGFFGLRKSTPPTETVVIDGVFSAAPEVARITDPTLHNPPLLPGPGSPNVFVGNLPVWRTAVDTHACPIDGSVGKVALGAPTVFVNNMMICRAGDLVIEVPAGPDPIKQGCPTVFAGMPAPPFTISHIVRKPGSKESTDLKLKTNAEGDLLVAEAKGGIGQFTENGKEFVGAKGEAIAALAKGSVQQTITIPIPFTGHSITLGAKEEGYAGAVGVKGTLGVSDGKFQIGGGAAGGLGAALTLMIGFN